MHQAALSGTLRSPREGRYGYTASSSKPRFAGRTTSAATNRTSSTATTTSSAAALLGVEEELGTVRPGKRADLVVVGGDPLDFDGLRERVEQVWKDGRLVAGG